MSQAAPPATVPPASYRLRHANGSVEVTVAGGRLVVKTQGTGLADRLRTVDIALSGLRLFSVVPTIAAQANVAPGVVDSSFDAELVFTYAEGTAVKKKRLFVRAADPACTAVVAALVASRPDASLLALPPAEAMARMGVLSARKALWIIVAVVVALPIVATALALLLGH